MPMRPSVSRKAINFSPSSFSRVGGASGLSSSGRHAGIQYSRISSPVGVPGPTRVRMSLCSIDNIPAFLLDIRTFTVRWYDYTATEGGARLDSPFQGFVQCNEALFGLRAPYEGVL